MSDELITLPLEKRGGWSKVARLAALEARRRRRKNRGKPSRSTNEDGPEVEKRPRVKPDEAVKPPRAKEPVDLARARRQDAARRAWDSRRAQALERERAARSDAAKATAALKEAQERKVTTAQQAAARRQDAARRAWDSRRAQAELRRAQAETRTEANVPTVKVQEGKSVTAFQAKYPRLAPEAEVGANIESISNSVVRGGVRGTQPDSDFQKVLGKTRAETEEYVKTMIADVPGKFDVTYSVYANRMSASFISKDGTRITRVFTRTPKGLEVEHAYFAMGRSNQGNNAGKALFRSSLAVYQEMGVSKITVHANIDVGGYAWARYGFTPSTTARRRLSTSIVSRARGLLAQRKIPPDVFDHIKSLGDKDTPDAFFEMVNSKYGDISIAKQALLGSDWNGSINLKDSRQYNRVEAYVRR